MKRLNLKMIWARKRAMMSSGIAVVIGIAFLTATMALGNSMTAGVKALVTEGFAPVDVQVRQGNQFGTGEDPQRAPLLVALADELARVARDGRRDPNRDRYCTDCRQRQ